MAKAGKKGPPMNLYRHARSSGKEHHKRIASAGGSMPPTHSGHMSMMRGKAKGSC